MSDNTSIQKTKLDAIANTSLASKLFKKSSASARAMLIDVSGSMLDCFDGTNKYAIVRKMLAENNFDCPKFIFSDYCRPLEEDLPEYNPMASGTNMVYGFETMAKHNLKSFILITDGLPDSPDRTIRTAKENQLNISIIYIGPQPAPQFLRDLADASNGGFINISEIKAEIFQKSLAAHVQRLLK